MQILHILIYSCLLFSLLLLLTVDAKQADLVPGCADLNAIAKADSYNGSFCFCSVPDGGSNVHISCLYSSTLEQFRRAFLAVTAAKKAVQQVTLNRVEFEAAILPGKIFDSPYASIQIISIDKCSQNAPLNIHDDSFHGLAEHLEELYITGCNLEQFPRAAIRNLTKLRTLSLAYNKLTNLRRMDFEPLKRLEILNLEGNFISSLENGTLLALRNSLKKLSFGNHNFVGDSIFDEISQLSELQVLDMDRADGITDIAQGTFERMNKLEKLLLPGCSLTIIHRNTFRGLTKLTELDLRINLLNEVECGSFTWTPNLRRLSLAGNYLNESFACWWDGLEHLKELDLGWNEFLSLENNAFSKLGQTLALLNLRHNTRLVQIDEDAFNGLSNLRRLNLSEINIAKLNNSLKHLPSLEELDLSSGKLQLIDDSDLQAQTENLQRLILRNNQLTTLSRNILENMKNLQVLDLSDNQWLCDENMEAVVEEIELKYKEAVLTDQKFILLHANETSCDYPHNLKGQIIMNVIKELFKSNNYSEDIIYSSTPMIPIMDNGINLEDINTSVFTELLAKGTLIGDENTKIEHHLNTSSTVRPLYHVNMKTELINEHMKINPAPVIIVAITLILVSTAVIVAVARHLRKQKSRIERRSSLEMNDKRYSGTSNRELKRHSKVARTDQR